MREFPFGRFQHAVLRGTSLSIARNDPDLRKLESITPAIRKDVGFLIEDVEQICAAANLVETVPLVLDLKQEMRSSEPRTPLEVFTITSIMSDVMASELSKQKFFMLRANEAAAFEHPHYLGESVWKAFPSARMDIAEMGSCYACGRYNAAAYHAVQAAEVGLRELARDRRAKTTFSRNPIPLDQAQWGDLIKAIKVQTDKILGDWTKGPAKDAAQQFYEKSLMEANALNDGWRRHLAHARSHQFEEDETIALIGHVRRFLERLSTRIGEGRKPTPIKWKSAKAGFLPPDPWEALTKK